MARAALTARLARLERRRERRGCPTCGPGAPVTFRPAGGDDAEPEQRCDECGRRPPSMSFGPLTFDGPGLARALADEVPMSPCSPDGL